VRSVPELAGAQGIVIPGVGHFGATRTLDEPWRAGVRAAVDAGTPLLGICLGMQWLYEGSEEEPGLSGLGVLPGRVSRMTGDVKVPHVGWNTLEPTAPSPLLDGLPSGAAVYFTHSYAAPVSAATVATSHHGTRFAAMAEAGNIAGMQFHPEKSGAAGLTLLRNWLSRAV
jgi:glutamine amidotransferase